MIDMMQVWKEKIDQISEQIKNTESGKDGRLIQLSNCKTNLEIAFHKCLDNHL